MNGSLFTIVPLENEVLCIRLPETLKILFVIRGRKDIASRRFGFQVGKIRLRNSRIIL